MNYGKKVWIFPDAELPPIGANLIPGHESVIITNVTDEEAVVKFTLSAACAPIVSAISASTLQLSTSSTQLCWNPAFPWLLSTAVLNPALSISTPLPATANKSAEPTVNTGTVRCEPQHPLGPRGIVTKI